MNSHSEIENTADPAAPDTGLNRQKRERKPQYREGAVSERYSRTRRRKVVPSTTQSNTREYS
ncbi:MAG: hypothetical protein ABJ056_06190, partial [Halioglobus sp.]